ncbi:MAG: carboxypeptidase-like regulatory domain-containing protein [Nitrospira sp.]|nr:carboxypeptidase-like regulatory domain-containing protein [Nitrospira sp.]
MSFTLYLFIFLIAVIPLCYAGTINNTGIISGTVTRGPVCPAEREDICKPEPVEGVKVVISDLSGQEVKSVITDKTGKYNIKLSPGRYKVGFISGLRFRRDSPEIIEVITGEETHLDFQIDTGVR